jgi:hypothetical protein
MKTPVRAGLVYATCALIAGCAAPGATSPANTTAAPVRASISARDAKDAIVIGKSTKAEVIAALGKTQVVSFDSGFEVWIYRYQNDTPAKADSAERVARAGSGNGASGKAEFVVLFAPSGVVAKTRIRPAPAPSEARGK